MCINSKMSILISCWLLPVHMTGKHQASTINILAMLPANFQLTDGAKRQIISLWKTWGVMTAVSRAVGRSLCPNTLLMRSSHIVINTTQSTVLTGATLIVIWCELEVDCKEAVCVCVTQSYSAVKTISKGTPFIWTDTWRQRMRFTQVTHPQISTCLFLHSLPSLSRSYFIV